MYREALYEIDSHVAKISLNNSANRNRLNYQLVETLKKFFIQARRDPHVRAIVLSAAGEVFCDGMDFSAAINSKRTLLQSKRSLIHSYQKLLNTMYHTPKPIIAVVNGSARAGGIGLIAVCDVAVGSERAQFELSELLFGLIPAAVIPYLAQRISLQKIRLMSLSANAIDAATACQYGLLDEVVAPSAIEKYVKRCCRQFLRLAPHAIGHLKRVTARPRIDTVSHQAGTLLYRLYQKSATQNAIKNFLAGETPAWFCTLKPQGSLSGVRNE